MCKMYTRKGDTGNTTIKGKNIRKSSDTVDVLGSLDITSSYVCDAYRILDDSEIRKELSSIINLLYKTSSLISGYIPYDKSIYDITVLESYIDNTSIHLKPLTNFILPCQTEIGSVLDKCRVYVRKLETTMWRYTEDNNLCYEELLVYLNRLSSYFFTLSRYASSCEEEVLLKNM